MIQSIADLCPRDAESGVGLALQDDQGRYLFFLAGKGLYCPPGERFYAGIGGHREADEDWLACAHREALEEVGTDVEVLSAPVAWYIPQAGPARRVELSDRPRPLALYEMIHPPGTPRAGGVYRIVVYRARLCGLPENLQEDEVLAIIALTREQVIRGPERKPALAELLDQGARIVSTTAPVDGQLRLYPLGTACALAHILHHMHGSPVQHNPLARGSPSSIQWLASKFWWPVAGWLHRDAPQRALPSYDSHRSRPSPKLDTRCTSTYDG